jgi:general secretion pathway protein G
MRIKHLSTRQTGFTLVELLIVVIILGILAAIVLPQFTSSTDDARVSALDANLSTLRSAVELYYQQHGAYPSAAGDGTNAANSVLAFNNQLTKYSSAAGVVSNTKDATTYKFGPYLKKDIPNEPVSGSNVVEIITTGTLGMTNTSGTSVGWKFDNKSGQLIANTTANATR